MIINSVICDTKWNIATNELSEQDIEFIKTFNPRIYWNDMDCYNWCFDEKLPSGRFLENIRPNNSLTEIKAVVL